MIIAIVKFEPLYQCILLFYHTYITYIRDVHMCIWSADIRRVFEHKIGPISKNCPSGNIYLTARQDGNALFLLKY